MNRITTIQTGFYIRLLAILLLVLCSMPLLRGQTAEETTTVEYGAGQDEEKTTADEYEYREFSESRLNELRNDRQFQYDRMDEDREQRRREWERDMKRENRVSRKETGESPAKPDNSGSTNWLVILLIFGAAVVVIMVLLGLKPGLLFRRRGRVLAAAEEAPVPEEDIHNMRFETELEKAIRLGNYRLAVRIQYLDTLKKLSDRNLITWMPNKTNWEYARELGNTPYDAGFRQVTSAFEYAWYGEFVIDEPVFRLMQEKMIGFQKKL